MIEVILSKAGEFMKIKISDQSLSFASKETSFEYLAFIDQGLVNGKNLTMLRRKKGEKFFAQWLKDLKRFKSMKEGDIADEIIKDEAKDGWGLVGRSWQ